MVLDSETEKLDNERMSDYKSNSTFSPDEVNALIPRLEEHFQNFWSFREGAQNILEELRVKAKGTRDIISDDYDVATAATARRIAHLQIRKSQAHYLLEQAKKELDAIMEMGCAIKDLESGIVDFPHMLEFEEEEVFLCWRFGEKKVRFWHETDKGFTSRKPLFRKIH